MVARLNACHPLPNLDDDTGALMTEHDRKEAFRIRTGECECVRVVYPGMGNPDQDLAFLRRRNVQFHNLQRLAGSEGDCGA